MTEVEARRDKVEGLYRTMDMQAVAAALGISIGTVYNDLVARGVQRRPRGRQRSVEDQELGLRAVALRRELWTVDAIAAELCLSEARVVAYIREALDEAEQSRIKQAIWSALRPRTATRVELTCAYCDARFTVKECEMQPTRRVVAGEFFCSHSCAALARCAEHLREWHELRANARKAHGGVDLKTAAELTNWSKTTLLQGEKLPIDRRIVRGRPLLSVDPYAVLQIATVKKSACGSKLNAMLSARRGTVMGAKRIDRRTDALIRELGASGMSTRQIEAELKARGVRKGTSRGHIAAVLNGSR